MPERNNQRNWIGELSPLLDWKKYGEEYGEVDEDEGIGGRLGS